MNCFVLKKTTPMKGVITGVAVDINVDQLGAKIPGVCDAHPLMRRRQGGESGETEDSLSVLLSFEVESLPDKVKLGYKLSCMSIKMLLVSSLWACGISVKEGGSIV